MPRRPRCDRPGRWFHVFNRGLARRPVFETEKDIRFFRACLAHAVRRGEIEIHAFCILTTHFHLLVRSPTGRLAEAMDRIQNRYVRYYNRMRRRDGSLFRGRYGACLITSATYWWTCLRYIDRNAVVAGLSATPWSYPHASAHHYANRRRPPWLTTDRVDAYLRERGHGEPWRGYAAVFGGAWSEAEEALVQARLRGETYDADPLDDLIDAAPPAVRRWMQRKAALADGGGRSAPTVSAASIDRALEQERRRCEAWPIPTTRGPGLDGWSVARAHLLHELAALGWTEIGLRLGVDAKAAGRRGERARRLLLEHPAFGDRLARVAREALDQTARWREM